MRRPTIKGYAIAGLALVSVLATCVAIGEARADPARGLALAERWCAQCHGIRPNQASPTQGVPSFSEIAVEPSATAMSLRVFLRTPHPTMPNLILDADELDDLVGYILSMKPARPLR